MTHLRCSSTKGDDNLLCHGTFSLISLHSMINLSRPAFASITSCNSFLLAHAVWTKYKQYKILAYYKYKAYDVYASGAQKSVNLPFCKPFLFPNGLKTKNHLEKHHGFCMLTKLHWSNTLCLIHLDKAK